MTLSHIIEIAGQIFWPLMLLFFLINRKFRTIIIHFFFMQPILLLSLAIYTVKIMIEMIWFISYDLWKGNFDVSRFINLFGVEITTIFFLSTLHMFVLYFVKKFMKEKPIPINFLKWFIHDGLSELNSLSTIDDELHPPIISKELSNFCLVFPHGIWPYSFSLSVFNRYPKNAGYAFCAGILLKVPLLTLFLSILCNFSIKSVSKKSIVDYLTNKIYHNKISIIYLGEIADQMLTAPGVNGINMCGHKGFLRLCLKHGCNLNIAYYFNGENM
jgi:hypothetical protein